MHHPIEMENDPIHTDTKESTNLDNTIFNIELTDTLNTVDPTQSKLLDATIQPLDYDQLTHITSDVYSDNFFKFKQHVNNKRKATFCCIFSTGALIISIILLSAPLFSQMFYDWRLYNTSTRTHCTLLSVTNNTEHMNNTKAACNYVYRTTDGHSLSALCGSTMHETASCNTQSSMGNDCYFYDDDDDECSGTMLYTSNLKRNNNIFLFLLGIGVVFAVITIISCIYGMHLTRGSGIYCSLNSVQMDGEMMFRLMQQVQRENKGKKKRHKWRKRRRKQRHSFDEDFSDDFNSIFSSQFGSSITVPSGWSILDETQSVDI